MKMKEDSMNIQYKIHVHLSQVAPHQRNREQVWLLDEAQHTIELLKQSLYRVKDHMNVVTTGNTHYSAVWNIANKALIDAGLDLETDNDRLKPQDKSRKEFESWIMAPPYEHMCDRSGDEMLWPGQYKRYETQLAWEAWQESRRLLQ